MRRETILKVILVLVIGMVLFINPVNVFATSGSGTTDLNDLFGDYEDQGGLEDLEQEQTPSTPSTTTPSTTPSTTQPTTTPSTTEKEETLPEAGLAEDTMMVVSIVALGATAIFALKKVNEYKNI